jgi:paraquat-inducible protein B
LSQRANPTLIGAFVLCGAALAIGALIVFGSGDLFKTKIPCVMFFDGSINGLTIGSQVKVRGVPVGTVIGIDMPIQTSATTARIAVFAELSPPRTYTRQLVPMTRDRLAQVIENGLRARLDTESFVTGVLYIDLDFQPDQPAVLLGTGPPEFLEIPTLPPRVGEAIRKLLANLEEIDFKAMVSSITAAAQGLDDFIHSPRIDQGITSLDQTLTSYRDLAKTLDTNLKARSQELEGTLNAVRSAVVEAESAIKTGEGTLTEVTALARDLRGDSAKLVDAVNRAAASTQEAERQISSTLATVDVVLDPNAPLVQQLHETLAELGRASHSFAVFTSELERNPSALVRGRDTEGKKP